ncbi:MAG: hypothetical protein BWZ03_00439 [bacterium ADurb.BinA186]|nr:MAG: hypothetical protein BWZ03_00439 [bacterium ADurb.BinA186]
MAEEIVAGMMIDIYYRCFVEKIRVLLIRSAKALEIRGIQYYNKVKVKSALWKRDHFFFENSRFRRDDDIEFAFGNFVHNFVGFGFRNIKRYDKISDTGKIARDLGNIRQKIKHRRGRLVANGYSLFARILEKRQKSQRAAKGISIRILMSEN